MLKRKLTKVAEAIKNMLKSGKNKKKYLTCCECNDVEVEVGIDIGAVTCAYCVQRSCAPPPTVQKASEGEKFPRGWALKATYIHTDGRIFEKGKDTGQKYTPTSSEAVVEKKKSVPKKSKKVAKAKKTKRKK